MSTARAVLRRRRGVHREKAPTGPGCLVGDVRCERGPRRSMDTRGETGGMPHPVDRQVVDGNHRKGVDEPAAVLVGEGPPTPGEARMETGDHPSPAGPLRGALLTVATTPRGT